MDLRACFSGFRAEDSAPLGFFGRRAFGFRMCGFGIRGLEMAVVPTIPTMNTIIIKGWRGLYFGYQHYQLQDP